MQTEHLIKALAADAGLSRIDLSRRLTAALAIGFLLSVFIFVITLGPRPDVATALTHDPRFALKFAVTLTLALAATGLVLRFARPGAAPGWWRVALLIAPALLAAGVLYEMLVIEPSLWRARAIGRNAIVCLISVPVLAAPILLALLLGLKASAPTRPGTTGAVAGLVAAGLGAALYAAHCLDDSPLFVMVWYSTATAIVGAAGALIGVKWLRW